MFYNKIKLYCNNSLLSKNKINIYITKLYKNKKFIITIYNYIK